MEYQLLVAASMPMAAKEAMLERVLSLRTALVHDSCEAEVP